MAVNRDDPDNDGDDADDNVAVNEPGKSQRIVRRKSTNIERDTVMISITVFLYVRAAFIPPPLQPPERLHSDNITYPNIKCPHHIAL